MKAPTLNKLLHAGEYGNAAVLHALLTLEGDAVATFNVARIPAGTKVCELKAIIEALGASTTLAFGYAPVDSTLGPAANATYFGTAAATNTATNREMYFKPISFQYDVYLTVTLAGAAGTGDVDLVMGYEFVGK